MTIQYLTADEILSRLVAARASRRFQEFHRDIESRTGMQISRPHLANILAGRRSPNAVVLRYLGAVAVERETVYQITNKAMAKIKRNGRVAR